MSDAASATMAGSATRGRFITFEGGEGAGKSTQVRLLVEYLRARGRDVVATREPGGSPNAEALRDMLLAGLVAPFGPAVEALIFSAARVDHIEKLIRPALERGAFVVCDRFADSTRAYQGASGKLATSVIDGLEAITIAEVRPDLTILLDLPVEEGLARARQRRGDAATDRFEAEGVAFHEALRARFLAIAAADPGRCVVVDARQSAEAVAEAIRKIVDERLPTSAADPS